MTTIGNKFAQLGTSIINLVGTRASKNMDNLTSTGEANIVEIIENAGISGKGSGHSIGEVVYSAIPISDACFHLLDGGLIYGDGIYNDFVTYMSTLYAADPTANYWTTETDWQSSVTTYGVCGKFVYDSTNNTVRLPKITGIIEGTTDLTALGDLVQAGLPNITGKWTPYVGGDNSGRGWDANNVSISGAFGRTATTSAKTTSNTNNKYSSAGVTFDASRSSSIYGNSSTVQPQTIKAFYYIVITTSTKTDIQVDIDEIATDLNSKVDKSDLAEVQCVVETYSKGTSWYRVYSDGWCEQGGIISIPSTNTVTTITLLKPFANTNYSVVSTANPSSVIWSNMANCQITAKTTSSFGISNNVGNSNKENWQACGYIEV